MRFPTLLLLTVALASSLSIDAPLCPADETTTATTEKGTEFRKPEERTLRIFEFPSTTYSCRVNVTLPDATEGGSLKINGRHYRVPASRLLQLQMESNPAIVRLEVDRQSKSFLARQGNDYYVTSASVPPGFVPPAPVPPAPVPSAQVPPAQGAASPVVSVSADLKAAQNRLRRQQTDLANAEDVIQRFPGEIGKLMHRRTIQESELLTRRTDATNHHNALQMSYTEHQRLKELETTYGSTVAGYEGTLRNLDSISQDGIAPAIGQVRDRFRQLRDVALEEHAETVRKLKELHPRMESQEIAANEKQAEIDSIQTSLDRTTKQIARREKQLQQARGDSARLQQQILNLQTEIDVLNRISP